MEVSRHFEYLKRAAAQGDAILVGRTQDEQPLGLVVFEADDEQQAVRFMQDDPAVRGGVFKAELRPYKIALMRAEHGDS